MLRLWIMLQVAIETMRAYAGPQPMPFVPIHSGRHRPPSKMAPHGGQPRACRRLRP